MDSFLRQFIGQDGHTFKNSGIMFLCSDLHCCSFLSSSAFWSAALSQVTGLARCVVCSTGVCGSLEILATADCDGNRVISSFLLLKWCLLGVHLQKSLTCCAKSIYGKAVSSNVLFFPWHRLKGLIKVHPLVGRTGDGGHFHCSGVKFTSLFPSWLLGCCLIFSSMWKWKLTDLAHWIHRLACSCRSKFLEFFILFPHLHHSLLHFHAFFQLLLLSTS